MRTGSVHCPQCRLYVTSPDAEECPRCGYSLAESQVQRPDSFAFTADASPRWPPTPQYQETPIAPYGMPPAPYGTPPAPYGPPSAPNQAAWPDAEDQNTIWSPSAPRGIMKNPGSKMMLQGCLFSVAGLLLTAVSYALASPGGTYFLFWGLILYGGVRFLRGLFKETRS
jgi:hypothetical protein